MLTVLTALLGLGVFAAVVVFPVAMGMLASISPRLPDWVCRCGYPLVGLPVQGACPECGLVYNQHVWEPWTPDWGSPVEWAVLRFSPAIIAVVVTATGLLFIWGLRADDVFFLLAVAAGAAVPAIALSVLTPSRVPRVAAWMVALFGPIFGAVGGTLVCVESANSSDAIGMYFSVIFAGGLTSTCSGMIAIVAALPALGRQKRMLAARRAAVQTARRAVKSRAAASTSARDPDKPS